jgi:hypothetical protein
LVNIYTFPVKKPGAYQLRLAIRDTATDKVGSANQFIEIPNLKKDRLALSSVVLEDLPYAEYQRLNSTGAAATLATTYTDSSLRQFKAGTVLTYGFSIFNPRPGSVGGGDLEWQLKLYRDGKLMFDGKPQKVAGEQTRPNVLEAAGSLMLGTETGPGDYVLQITATDKLAPPKKNSATQFVQFEIVE